MLIYENGIYREMTQEEIDFFKKMESINLDSNVEEVECNE